jgi:Gpi18-like mannosyltransferase
VESCSLWVRVLGILGIAALLRVLRARAAAAAVFHDLGAVTDVWARWDSGWFLRIAEHGYHAGAEPAFYPLYPATVALLGRVLLGHYVLAGILVSLAASFASFLLLEQLGPR